MYWLKEVVGEDGGRPRAGQAAAAVRVQGRAVSEHARISCAILRAEAGPQHDALITDLFEKITLLDMKATARHGAQAARRHVTR